MGRKAIALLVLLGVVVSLVPATQAQTIITKVERRNPDGNSGDTEPALAPAPLADASVAMVDRAHIYKNIPEALLGVEYVMVANDDKDNPNYELHVTIGKAATLYLFIDNRVGTNTGGEATNPDVTAAVNMTWVTQLGFVDTSLNLAVDESADGDIDNYYSVFSKQVTPGVIILKAQNDAFTGGPGGRNMYGVAAAAPRVKAAKPVPANGEQGVTLPLFQWTAGTTAVLHNVYLGTSPELTEADLVSLSMPMTLYYHAPGLTPGVTYYWRVDEIEADLTTVHTGDVWTFMSASLAAFQPVPADGAAWIDPNVSLSWTPGRDALSHDIYFGADKAAVENGSADVFQKNIYLTTWKPSTLESATTYYWRIDEIKADGTKTAGQVWSFRTVPLVTITDPNLIGWWKLDEGAGTRAFDSSGHGNHGTVQRAGRIDGIYGGALSFDGAAQVDLPPALIKSKLGSMAFWVRTAQTAVGTIFYGTQTAGNGYGGENELQVNIDNNQARLYLEGAPDVSIMSGAAINNNEWQHVAATWDAASVRLYVNGNQVGQAANSGNDFVASAVTRLGRPTASERYYIGGLDDVRLYNKGLSADEVKQTMRGDPSLAWDPQPARNANLDIRSATALSWSAGEAAAEHDVYFGKDNAAVANGDTNSPEYKGRQAGTDFSLAGLVEFGGGAYFWRIDEVNGDGSISRGFVWSFTLADYLIVDDFESYNDEVDKDTRIYETWLDGLTNQTTSTVGNWDPPFAEQTIVHSGRQSMPMDYNNVNSPYYAEAEREFSPLGNWTTAGVTDLVVWFRGNPVIYMENAGVVTMSGSGHDIWDNADDFRFASKRLSGNGSVVVRVESLVNTNGWAKAGVMIRESLNADSKFAYMIVSAAQGVSFGWRQLTAGTCGSVTQTGVAAPQWVKLTRTGDAFTAQYSADGQTWTDMKNADGTVASTSITMTSSSVYIGLCVTSHNTAATTTAVFSGAAATGNVTGAWQVTAIGDDPEPGNSPQSLYLVAEDSAGKSKVVTHPDPMASAASAWTEWKIPLSELAPVNLNKVKKLYVGVGDRNNATPDGNGRIYIDDIRLVVTP